MCAFSFIFFSLVPKRKFRIQKKRSENVPILLRIKKISVQGEIPLANFAPVPRRKSKMGGGDIKLDSTIYTPDGL